MYSKHKINKIGRYLDKSNWAMFLFKLEAELEITIESGNAFHILITRLVKKFLSSSEITCSLANFSELPRVASAHMPSSSVEWYMHRNPSHYNINESIPHRGCRYTVITYIKPVDWVNITTQLGPVSFCKIWSSVIHRGFIPTWNCHLPYCELRELLSFI